MTISTPIVHVIDDDHGIRQSLRAILEVAGFSIELHDSAEHFLVAFDPSQIGCIMVDLRMPKMDGISLLQELRSRHCEIPIIAMSGLADVTAAVLSMKLGAIDLLQKPIDPRALLPLVRRAIGESVAVHAKRSEEEGVRRRFADLTMRETQLLKLVIAGFSNKQIASELGISIKTVANHRAHLMEKTRAANAADLARLSVMAGVSSGVPPA